MSMSRSLRGALRLIGKERRRRLLAVAALGLVASLFEAASAVVVLILMRLILEPAAGLELPVFGDVQTWLPVLSHAQLVTYLAVAFAGFFIVRAGVFLLQRYALARVVENSGVALADELLRGYLQMPYEAHLRRNSAELVRNTYDNVQQVVGNVFTPIVELIVETVLVVTMLAVLLLASPALTALATVVIGTTVLLTMLVVQPRLRSLGRLRQESARRALQELQQGFAGVRDVKLHGSEARFAARFRRARLDMARAQRGRVVLSYVPRVAIETVFLMVVLVTLVVAVRSGAVESTLSTLGVFAYAGLRIQPSIQKMAAAINSLRFGKAVIEDIQPDLDRSRLNTPNAGRPVESGPSLRLTTELRLESVTYAYPDPERSGAPKVVLQDVDLAIRPGERIGIVGPTGAGKSTLLDVIAGLLPPASGAVLVDGVDVSAAEGAWRECIGFVHQSPFLLDASLRENIALGTTADEIDESRVREAVQAAQLQALVEDLPDGLETVVGERGVRLSGGQRQRVTLARALYRQPSLLLLDEATSALDAATESAVVEALDALPRSLTIVIVAHRMTTVARCDRLIHLEDGRLRDVGTYEQLIRRSGAFRALAGIA